MTCAMQHLSYHPPECATGATQCGRGAAHATPKPMSIARYLREIGRGHDGARALTTEQARDLMTQLLDGQVSELEVGAFAIGMRIKGETLAELVGFLDALHARLACVESDRPVVVIPSYNGARRLPNLVALLACLVARDGVRVLVHGLEQDPDRITTASVMQAMGMQPCTSPGQAAGAWAAGQPAFVPVQALCPALFTLLQVRRTIGLRNSGHTLAKMMLPVQGAPALRLMRHRRPEFGQLRARYAEHGGCHIMLLRGTEGEAVADARRLPRLATWIDGRPRADLGEEPAEGTLPSIPDLPRDIGAEATANWIRRVLSGEFATPPSIAAQARRARQAVAELGARGTPT